MANANPVSSGIWALKFLEMGPLKAGHSEILIMSFASTELSILYLDNIKSGFIVIFHPNVSTETTVRFPFSSL